MSQTYGGLHALPQQSSSTPPQLTHTPPAPHTEYGALQPMPSGQHGWPGAPHVPPSHDPAEHVPAPVPHESPAPRHWLFTQHAPPLHD